MRIEDLLSTTRAGLPQCPDFTIVGALKRAAGELFRQSQAWQTRLDDQTTIPGVAVYDYGNDDGSRVEKVLWGRCGSRDLAPLPERSLPPAAPGGPTHVAASLEAQSLTLWPVPASAETLSLYVVLVPTPDAMEIPDDLATQYQPGITALARAELMTLSPGMPYYDPAGAAIQYRIADEWITRAKRRQTSGAWATMRVQPRPFV